MKRHVLNRRTMLRGTMGGLAVAVGLPALEAMLDANGEAYADGTPSPVRLVTWFFGNGVIRNRWIPGGLLTPVTGANYPLSPQLMPLEPVRDYVTVLSGFHNMCTPDGLITHHEGMLVFSGYQHDTTCQSNCMGFYSNASGPTIDQVAADHIGMLTPVPSIQIGVSKRQSGADFGTTMHNLSHKGPNDPLPPLRNPQDVFYRLFGSVSPPDDPSKPARLAVLDAVRDHAVALYARLGKTDQTRLDAHLEGLYELENKIKAIAPVCEFPAEPTETNTDDQFGNEPLANVNSVMCDLLCYAFTCDITRIGSVMLHEGASDTYFGVPNDSAGHHNNSHGFYSEVVANQYHEYDYGGLEQLNDGVEFIMTQLSVLLQKLHAVEEPTGGTLLDNSVIMVSSDCSEGWSHDVQRDQPFLLCGGGGGRLLHPGVHLRVPNMATRNICDATLTALQAVVPEVYEIGAGATHSANPISELLVST